MNVLRILGCGTLELTADRLINLITTAMFARGSQQVPSLVRAFHRMNSTIQSGKLAGKIAVVTASTDGIGLAIATHLAKDGAQVVVSSRKEANVLRTVNLLKAQGLSVLGIPCHVGKASDRERLVQETVEKFGGIDILVSNAAVNPVFGPMLDCPEEAWDKIFDINVKAAFLLTQKVVPIMEKRNGGSIVFISSIGGYHPFSALGVYSVSKTALLGLTKALSSQCAGSNIRVNCVAPGVIETKFSGALVDNEAVREKVLEQIPLGRIGQPRDIGGIVSFLASEDASYVTGETFVVAGGMPSRL